MVVEAGLQLLRQLIPACPHIDVQKIQAREQRRRVLDVEIEIRGIRMDGPIV